MRRRGCWTYAVLRMGAAVSEKLSGSRTGLPDNGGRVRPREMTCRAAPQRERHHRAQGVAAIHVMAELSHVRRLDARAVVLSASTAPLAPTAALPAAGCAVGRATVTRALRAVCRAQAAGWQEYRLATVSSYPFHAK